ncbi:uncharacterized protein METZ01_LOCUS341615 [marine metagenome]|uniref:Uncharacterized protein n=1 Tax=marine metagenome TaxID=408172 RepID=A0A382QWQ4_9ZZZZ
MRKITFSVTLLLFLAACGEGSGTSQSTMTASPTATVAQTTFPRVCQPWMGIQNRPDSTVLENIARHAVYNRSGAPQIISLGDALMAVSTGNVAIIRNIEKLDGEIYLTR